MKRKTARKKLPKVKIKNTGTGLTSQAGLFPVVRYLQKLGLSTEIKKHIDIKSDCIATYKYADIIEIVIVAIIGGATSLTGICAIWSDRVLRKVSGFLRIPHDSHLGRIFKRFMERHIVQFETLNHKLRKKAWDYAKKVNASVKLPENKILIDVDSTVKTVYGNQEGADKGYNPKKKGANSYHPLLAFCVETKEILQGWLRPGSTYTGNGIVEFMSQLAAQLPTGMKIILRADSGFFCGAILDWLEARGNSYLIKVKLPNLMALLLGQEWSPIKDQPGWEQCTFTHQCHDWIRARQFVALRCRREDDNSAETLLDVPTYDYFCYVTDLGLTPWQTHKEYGKRATCETWIEEAKNQMGLAHIKTGDFVANSALFQCAIMAYNVVRWMSLCSQNKVLRQWEPQTIRTYLIRVAGKLICNSRQLTLKFPPSHMFKSIWENWLYAGGSIVT